jgi:hypothetical protein
MYIYIYHIYIYTHRDQDILASKTKRRVSQSGHDSVKTNENPFRSPNMGIAFKNESQNHNFGQAK